jgi:hypothetical protein
MPPLQQHPIVLMREVVLRERAEEHKNAAILRKHGL